jgi:hypothetical protein
MLRRLGESNQSLDHGKQISERVTSDLDYTVVTLVFLPRRGSRDESRMHGKTNASDRTQARVGSKRSDRCRYGSRSGMNMRQATVINLCCHIPGKYWVHDPLGVVGATAVVMVLVVVVAVLYQPDML